MSYAVQGALVAHHPAASWTGQLRRLALVLFALALAVTLVAIEAPVAQGRSPNAPEAAAAKGSETARVLRFARSHLGKRFRMGTEGMRYFDCSGLVFRVYKQAGLVNRIGGGRWGATSYYRWFQRRGLASRSNPKPGDLIIWGKRGKVEHMGIYVGGHRAISALINPWGVRSHSVNGIHMRLMAYLHVRLER